MSDASREDARERYRRDPYFAHLVDVMRQELSAHRFSPTEMREALTLAATLYYAEHPVTSIYASVRYDDE